jgi:hypothetical protein
MPVCPLNVARSEPRLSHLSHCLSASRPPFLPADMIRVEVPEPPNSVTCFSSLSVPHSRHDMAPDHVIVILPTLQHPEQLPECQTVDVLDMAEAQNSDHSPEPLITIGDDDSAERNASLIAFSSAASIRAADAFWFSSTCVISF